MIIIAIDLGKVRTGLAICDQNEFLASPLGTIEEKNRDKLAKEISKIAKEKKAKEIVLGLPKNMDGSEGESALSAREFKILLSEYTDIPIIMRDERVTTISAHNYLNIINIRSKKRKSVIDSVSAVIILQNYLDFKKNQSINN